MLQKRGQITAFLIIGMLLLLFFGIVFYLNTFILDSTQVSVVNNQQLSFFPPQTYVEYCVETELIQLLSEFPDSFSNVYLYDNSQYPFLYTQSNGNYFLTFEKVSDFLTEHLATRVSGCFDSGIYEEQGFMVARGFIEADVSVFTQTITVDLNFPLEIYNDFATYKMDRHRMLLPIQYGQIVLATTHILNNEIDKNWFDQTTYLHEISTIQNPLPINIIKQKPYPHTIYDVSLQSHNLTFSFAIEGVDTITPTGIFLQTQFTQSQNTCCETASLCASGVLVDQCVLAGGFFQTDCSCTESNTRLRQSQNFFAPNLAVTFADCGNYTSGDSWCSYNSGVGGRWFRNSCVNGAVVSESCRDYRQEVCSESGNVARCEPNLAQSCFACNGEDCCDSQFCEYVDAGVCVPKVSLGIKFWDAQTQYCDQIGKMLSSRFAQNITYAQRELVCSLVSDCTNQFNFVGDTQFGLPPADELVAHSQNISFNTSQVFQMPSIEFSQIGDNSFVFFLAQLENVFSFDLSDFLDPQQSITLDSAPALFCGNYVPPQAASCDLCGAFTPCSEYSCKSLGNCQYIFSQGKHECVAVEPNFVGEIQSVGVTSYNTLQAQADTLDMDDFVKTVFAQTSPPLPTTQFALQVAADSTRNTAVTIYTQAQRYTVDDIVLISFETTEPALCKASLLPIDFMDNQNTPLSKDYTQQHTYEFPLIGANLPYQISSFFGTANSRDLASALVSVKLQLDQLQLRYPNIMRFHASVFSVLQTFVSAYERTSDLILLALEKLLAEQQFTIFFSCVDEQGGVSDMFATQFGYNTTCANSMRLSLSHDGGEYTLRESTIYTSTLSECRYSYEFSNFEEMQPLSCASSIYDITPKGYPCVMDTTQLTFETVADGFTESQVFISCRERAIQKYDFNFLLSVSDLVDANPETEFSGDGSAGEFDDSDLDSPMVEEGLASLTTYVDELVITDFETLQSEYSVFVSSENTAKQILLSFPEPVLCETQEESLGCGSQGCVLPAGAYGDVTAFSVSCQSLPVSMLCSDTAQRNSQITQVTFQRPPVFSVVASYFQGTLQITSPQYSDLAEIANCRYRQRNANWIELDGVGVSELFFMNPVVLEVSCTDTYGQQASAFVAAQ